jgi:hypothetical protein
MTMAPMAPPYSRVSVILQAVADCLCTHITAYGLPPVCYCGVVPGSIAVADQIGECGDVCGMAWARLDQMYHATVAGVPSTEPGNCTKALSIDIEVGILRCMSLGGPGGPPEPSDLLQSTEVQMADAECMYRAISCCPALPTQDTVIAPYVPLGPDGGLVGGTFLCSVMIF